MIGEILHEIALEVTGDPGRMIAEIAQFLVLAAIIWIVGFGFGKRRGFVLNMLAERQGRVHAQLEEASGADARLEDARIVASTRESGAHEEAERLLDEAREGSEQSALQIRSEADAEAERIVERARTAVENERAQMQADLREHLVELVSQASRAIMNEKLTVAEQRARIEETILAGVASASQSAAPPERAVRGAQRIAADGGGN